MKINKRFVISGMIFFFLIYGGKLFNIRIKDVTLFVFNCPYNLSTAIEGSCLFFTEIFDSNLAGDITTALLVLGSGILSILIFGKLLCAFICPFGFIQDVLYKVRGLFRIPKIDFNEKITTSLNVIRWLLVVVFFVGIGFCTFCPVRYVIPPLAGYQTEIEIGFFISIFVMGLSFVNERFFCKVCPLGTTIGLFNKISPFKLKKNCTACTECAICYEKCPMDIKEIYTERETADVFMSNCILCGECVNVCPEDNALKITALGVPVMKSSRKRYYKKNK